VARPLASVERQDEPDQGIRKRLFAVLKSVEHLTTIQDTEGRYLFVTSVPPADSLADVIGKSPSDILDSYNAAVVMEQVQQVALRGDSRNRLTRITLGEETLNFLSQVSPVRDSSGNVTAVATVSRKIDDHAWTKGDFAALTSPALPSLTKRELQVLKLIASGLTSRQIAQKLFISRKTVETHRSRMMQKLDLHTTADLVKYSFRFGL